MNSLDLLEALKRIETHTIGVYPADKIPKFWGKPAALIVNTDDHTKPGTHWVALYVNGNGNGYYFDSYGLPPIIPQHLNRLRRNCNQFRWNTKQLQSNFSSVCGQFCILFLHYMCSGFSMHQFLSLFSDDFYRNDKLVRDYYNVFMSSKHYLSHSREFTGNGILHFPVQGCCSKLLFL